MKRCRLPHWLALLLLPVLLSWLPATTIIAPDFDQLVNTADFVVRAKVKAVATEWRQNPDNPGKPYIGTNVELEVLEVISGTPPTPLVLSLVGGRIGDRQLTVDGSPHFEAGQENILFIRGNGQRIVPLVGMHYGHYHVRRDARTGEAQVMRSGGKLLYNENEVALPDSAVSAVPARDPRAKPLTPAQFGDLIRKSHRGPGREKLQ